ncbi:MAG: DNA translocase FtsK 4TM domain-containing protein [Bacilli bacterium]|nr:DNA translocase FtsK 4TM domain-containing protein [Bacilli bacterium]MDD4733795.1 DNA translocase FtsK 4TM domain-containing protein [Bacilli bacterium]
MAKKKKKTDVKKTNNFQIELTGLFLILVSIIGLCAYGILGNFIQTFAVFLVGELYAVLLLLVAVIGCYMIFKRESPKYFTAKLIGFYLLILAFLTLRHFAYYDLYDKIEVLKQTWDNTIAYSKESGFILHSGGMIGALISSGMIKLLDIEGTRIVCIVIMVAGFLMFTGLSIPDIVKWIKSKIKTKDKNELKINDKIEITKIEEAYEGANKVVISSMKELINLKDTKEEKIIKEEIPESTSYFYPPVDLLNRQSRNNVKENELAIKTNIPVLESLFKDFGLEGRIVAAHVGPSVTQYEVEIKAGTKVNKILSLNREIALALAAKDVRIQAPIPGKKTIGIELPNKSTSIVTIREILERIPKGLDDSKLVVTLGRDIMGNPQYCEINKTPHLLVSGATGSGKSICINSMIVSILMRTKPDEVKLVLIDPKKVELSIYNGVPHLMAPVVTDPKKANVVLKKIVAEMERRYEVFEQHGSKNIAGYNLYVEKKNKMTDEAGQIKKLPYIVVIIDELADLMLIAAKEVEDSIMRITQMARAAGIHLIVATQRPSTDVITGLIKSNIPSRISFAVSSSIDSRTILDMSGAEKLLGKGDMLFLPQGENAPIRIQGTLVTDEEIQKVVDFVIKQQKAYYDETLTMDNEEMTLTTMVEQDEYEEPLYNEIVEFIVTQGKASASLLQRRFRLGYNRAARCIDLLEERGIVGPNNGSKPREVLVKLEKEEE